MHKLFLKQIKFHFENIKKKLCQKKHYQLLSNSLHGCRWVQGVKRVDEKKIFVCTGLCYGLLNVALFENLVMYVQYLVMYIQNLVIYLKILWSCDVYSKILWCILYILWCMFNILWCIFENLVMYIQYLVMYIRKSCDVYSIILWCMCNNSFLGNMMQWCSLKIRKIFIGWK